MTPYPAIITEDGDQYLVTFPDVPEALTGADCLAGAKRNALDALVTALGEYARNKKPLPKPSPAKGGHYAVHIPALIAAKLDLIAAMGKQGISGADLARRLGVTDTTVRRILDFNHRSHIDQVEEALAALGKVLEIRIRAA